MQPQRMSAKGTPPEFRKKVIFLRKFFHTTLVFWVKKKVLMTIARTHQYSNKYVNDKFASPLRGGRLNQQFEYVCH
jgi:hypothetical protein